MQFLSAKTWTGHFLILVITEFLCFRCEGQELLSTHDNEYHSSTPLSDGGSDPGVPSSETPAHNEHSISPDIVVVSTETTWHKATTANDFSNIPNHQETSTIDSHISGTPNAYSGAILPREISSTTLATDKINNVTTVATSRSGTMINLMLTTQSVSTQFQNTSQNTTSFPFDSDQTSRSAENKDNYTFTSRPVDNSLSTFDQLITHTKLPQSETTQAGIPSIQSAISSESYTGNQTYPPIISQDLTSFPTTDFTSESPSINEVNFEPQSTTSAIAQGFSTDGEDLIHSILAAISHADTNLNEANSTLNFQQTTIALSVTPTVDASRNITPHYVGHSEISDRNLPFVTSFAQDQNVTATSAAIMEETDFGSRNTYDNDTELELSNAVDAQDINTTLLVISTHDTTHRSDISQLVTKEDVSAASTLSYLNISNSASITPEVKNEEVALSPATIYTTEAPQTSSLHGGTEMETILINTNLNNVTSNQTPLSVGYSFAGGVAKQNISEAIAVTSPTEVVSESISSNTVLSLMSTRNSSQVTPVHTTPPSTHFTDVHNTSISTMSTSVGSRSENVSSNYHVPTTSTGSVHEITSEPPTEKLELVTPSSLFSPVSIHDSTVATSTELTAEQNTSQTIVDSAVPSILTPYSSLITVYKLHHTAGTTESNEPLNNKETLQEGTFSTVGPTNIEELSSSVASSTVVQITTKDTISTVASDRNSAYSEAREHTTILTTQPEKVSEASADIEYATKTSAFGTVSSVTEASVGNVSKPVGSVASSFSTTLEILRGTASTEIPELTHFPEEPFTLKRNLTIEEADNVVTVIFHAPKLTVENWYKDKDGIFRNFIIMKVALVYEENDITIPDMDNDYHSTHDDGQYGTGLLDSVVYIAPTPLLQGKNFIVSFIHYRTEDGKRTVTSGSIVLEVLKDNKEVFEETIEMEILSISVGIHVSVDEEATYFRRSIIEQYWIPVLSLSIIGAVSLVSLFLSVLYLRLRNRHSQSYIHDMTHLKREMNASTELGDLNLAADFCEEMCEKEVPGLVNGNGAHIIKMGDDECWVAPLQDVPLEDKNPPEFQDTRL